MKLVNDWKKVLKTYSFLSIAANLLVAISLSGLGVLGVLSPYIAFGVLATSAMILGVFGLIGRFIDQSLDDVAGDGRDD